MQKEDLSPSPEALSTVCPSPEVLSTVSPSPEVLSTLCPWGAILRPSDTQSCSILKRDFEMSLE